MTHTSPQRRRPARLAAVTAAVAAALVLAAYVVPLFTLGESDKTAGVVGAACFGYVAFEVNTDVLDLLFHASIGGIMMGIAMIGGLVCSLRALAAKR